MTGPSVKFDVVGADKYQAAVQNPGKYFGDPMLQHAKVETKQGGLPKYRTGGFAVVYKVSSRENPQHAEKHYALRCYKRLAPDLAARYAKISSHLHSWSTKSEFLISTTYHEKGVRIGRDWKPITTMQWVDGDFLDVFLDTAKDRPHEMNWLVNRLERLAKDLHRADMAHGDLHHKNLLVTRMKNRRLVLIDYDGMFVPALRGQRSNETGVIDYQHPQRDGSHFHAGLDRFALAVLYLNIVAVQRHPELWDAKGRTEGLLTGADDYAAPDQSAALESMARYPDLRSAVVRFRRLCIGSIDELPDPRRFFETLNDDPPVTAPITSRVPVAPASGTSRSGQTPIVSAERSPVLGTTHRELRAHADDEVTVIGKYSRFEKGEGTAASAYRTLYLESSGDATFEILVERDVARQFSRTGRPWSVNRSDWLAVTGVLLNDGPRFVIDLDQPADLQKLTSSGARRRLRRPGPDGESPGGTGRRPSPKPPPDPSKTHASVMSLLRGQDPDR